METKKRKWNGFGFSVEASRKGMATLRELHPEKVLEGQVLGGKVVGARINTCPNCGRQVKGNSGFGSHMRKCNEQLDK
jgi:hypothetical protein